MWDLDQMIGQKPKSKPNGRFVKGMTPHNKGRKWSEWMDGRKARRVKRNLTHTGNPNLPGWNKKAVAGVKNGKVVFFESANDADRKTGITARNIRHCCAKHRKHAGGCQWFFADDSELKLYL